MEKDKKSGLLNEIKKGLMDFNIFSGRVPLGQMALFAKHLAIMLRAGIPVTETLKISESSTQGNLKKIIGETLSSVRAGHSLSSSFANYPKVFSNLFVNVTRAGERSGTLVENLENIARELKKEKELISKIKGALLYPIVVLSAAFVLGIVLAFVVLPKITPLFEGLKMKLPFTTRVLILVSHIIQNYGAYIFPGIIIFVIFVFWLTRRSFVKPVTHWFLLHIPIVNRITKNANFSRFARTLGMLLKSGVNIDEALDITKMTMENYYFRRALDRVSRRVSMGVRLAEGLEESGNLFPLILTKMVGVGEESGKIEETLFYLGDFYEGEVDTATKALSTAIEPILLLIIGLVVGFLALSIITPIYNITGNIRR